MISTPGWSDKAEVTPCGACRGSDPVKIDRAKLQKNRLFCLSD
jgi:hypothetical protein